MGLGRGSGDIPDWEVGHEEGPDRGLLQDLLGQWPALRGDSEGYGPGLPAPGLQGVLCNNAVTYEWKLDINVFCWMNLTHMTNGSVVVLTASRKMLQAIKRLMTTPQCWRQFSLDQVFTVISGLSFSRLWISPITWSVHLAMSVLQGVPAPPYFMWDIVMTVWSFRSTQLMGDGEPNRQMGTSAASWVLLKSIQRKYSIRNKDWNDWERRGGHRRDRLLCQQWKSRGVGLLRYPWLCPVIKKIIFFL